MENDSLWSISPIDGRYAKKTKALRPLTSEGALIEYRLKVEVCWLNFLLGVGSAHPAIFKRQLTESQGAELLSLERTLPEGAADAVKEIEQRTNHDVKACEYYLQDLLKARGLSEEVIALLHFGCTSEDINNIAYALMQDQVCSQVLTPLMNKVIVKLDCMALDLSGCAMLSRTHGQSASPTTMGKELKVFAYRLSKSLAQLAYLKPAAKMNGAVGNYNAHVFVKPDVNWQEAAQHFIEKKLGLTFNPLTTQIENHDQLARFFSELTLFNTIGIDLCRDLWAYISSDYFKLKKKPGEVGSSTMPHKVNPIEFENAEGNFGLASGLAQHLAQKLPISRLQRDLSDSTALRSLGSVFAYMVIALESLIKGLGKLDLSPTALEKDLHKSWEVLAEPIQMLLRSKGDSQAYERLKAMSRGQQLSQGMLKDYIESLNLDDREKESLLSLRPESYLGVAQKLAQKELSTF